MDPSSGSYSRILISWHIVVFVGPCLHDTSRSIREQRTSCAIVVDQEESPASHINTSEASTDKHAARRAVQKANREHKKENM